MLPRVRDTEAPVAPELKFTGLPTDIVKSPTWTAIVAKWLGEPLELVPVIVTT